jgi:uncharacterized membrane protein YfcA
MLIYLPIAEMAVQAETIALLGAIVGIISGVFGIGGGFLTTPFLIFLGIPPAVAVGTQASQLVASSSTAVVGHWKKRHIDIKMAGVMLAGGLIGTISGVFIFKFLQAFGQIDIVISILYVVFLCGIGGLMLSESMTTLLKARKRATSSYDDEAGEQSMSPERRSRYENFRDSLPYKMSFPESKLYISALIPLLIGVVSGLMVSIMGIGAGFLLVPAMIYMLRMPPLLVAGTSLVQILITSAIACILHAVTNQTVDLVLASILIAGSVFGAQIGLRISKYIRGAMARFILASLIMIIGLKLGSELFIPPANLYSLVVQ